MQAAPAALVGRLSQAMAMLVETYAGKRLRPDDAVGQPVSTDLYRKVRWRCGDRVLLGYLLIPTVILLQTPHYFRYRFR